MFNIVAVRLRRSSLRLAVAFLIASACGFATTWAESMEPLFDIDAIRDASTLETVVLRDWEISPKDPSLRQKLIEVTVCEWWPGQKVRLPVTFLVPASGTPCHNVVVANQGLAPNPGKPTAQQLQLLQKHGVGIVLIGMGTIDAMQPKGELHHGMRKYLLATKDVRYTPAWIWGMSQMRALTATSTEPKYFQPTKVLTTGGSKRGVAAAVAGIADDRFTAIAPVVAPMLGNPGGAAYVIGTEPEELVDTDRQFYADLAAGKLGIDPAAAEALHAREVRRDDVRITLAQARESKWTDDEIHSITDRVWDACRITNHFAELQTRGLEIFYNVGTNDSVSPMLLDLGRQFPGFPVCIIPGGQHGGPSTSGFTRQVPSLPEITQNFYSFARHHFFGDRSFPAPPTISGQWDKATKSLSVRVSMPNGFAPEKNVLWWNVNRSQPYTLPFEYDHWESIELSKTDDGNFVASVKLDSQPDRIDIVSLHTHTENGLPLTFSSPYQRVVPSNH